MSSGALGSSRGFRVAVLVSGSGTNLQALIDAQERNELGGAKIACVVSNVENAFALERARTHKIDAMCIDHRAFPNRAEFDAALAETLSAKDADLVVLAGFMRLLTNAFLDPFKDRVINVHPSLLPAFPGAHALRDAIDYGVKLVGCTVHFVDEGTDTGPIIAQKMIPVHEGDDESTLRARVQIEEHTLLPEVVRACAEGRVKVVRDETARPRVQVTPLKRDQT